MSRLTIEVTGEEHQQIKALAAMQGQSIKDYVRQRLFPVGQMDSEEDAWKALQHLLLSRIESAEAGSVSNKTMREIAEEKLRELGKL